MYDLHDENGHEDVRVSIAGDWGTGTDEAEAVANHMKLFNPHFTVHIGDVYYIGGGRTRFRELRKRGVSKALAAKTAGSPHGPWRLADSPALHVALPNAYFAQLGLPPMVVRV